MKEGTVECMGLKMSSVFFSYEKYLLESLFITFDLASLIFYFFYFKFSLIDLICLNTDKIKELLNLVSPYLCNNHIITSQISMGSSSQGF